jgi:hypothetical protein
MMLLFSKLHPVIDAIRPLPLQPCRRSLSSVHAPDRMDITPEDVSLAGPPVESPSPELICNTTECQDSDSLYVLKLPPASTLDQRLFSELDHFLRTAVPGPSMESDTSHIAEVDSASSACDTDHTQLAIRSLVSSGSPTGAAAPSSPPSGRPSKRRRSASPQEEPPLDYANVEHIAKRLKHSSLSSSAIAIISPTASSTRRQYNFRQQNYATWCSARQLNYRGLSPQQIINYLADLHTARGLKLSTLATYSNSILALFSVKDQQAMKHFGPCVALKPSKSKPSCLLNTGPTTWLLSLTTSFPWVPPTLSQTISSRLKRLSSWRWLAFSVLLTWQEWIWINALFLWTGSFT